MAALVAIPLLRTIPGVQAVIEVLPFIGSVESENVDYRRTLIDVAFDAIWASPWFGGIDIYTVEGSASLKGGGGFIDVVNSYVGILLASGFVGLFFFLGFFATVCWGVYWATKQTRDDTDERRLLGRALLATLIGILVSILTVSSISVIPTVYWCIAGVAVAYARLASVEVRPVVSALRETKAESPGKFGRPTGASAGR